MNDNRIKFNITRSGVSGVVNIEDDGSLNAHWYEWNGDDYNRVAQAMGEALGFPVEYVNVHHSGNGHYSANLRHATTDEAAIQAKIAACFTLDYWEFPPYKRLSEMCADLGEALLHQKEIGNWIVDLSKINKIAFFSKWCAIALRDALEEAHVGNWSDARNAVSIAVSYCAHDGSQDAIALEMIVMSILGNHSLAASSVLVYGRSYGVKFALDLQDSIDHLCVELGRPRMFDVREIAKNFLEGSSEHSRQYDHELIELAEGE